MKLSILVLLTFIASFSNALTLEKYSKKPKLIVVLVIDQFRADYLTKYQKEFVPAAIKNED